MDRRRPHVQVGSCDIGRTRAHRGFVSANRVPSPALMLRSRAFGLRTQIFHALRRGVSKHAGTLSSPFETRARTFDVVQPLQHARSSG
jgi:hypothetical protein